MRVVRDRRDLEDREARRGCEVREVYLGDEDLEAHQDDPGRENRDRRDDEGHDDHWALYGKVGARSKEDRAFQIRRQLRVIRRYYAD